MANYCNSYKKHSMTACFAGLYSINITTVINVSSDVSFSTGSLLVDVLRQLQYLSCITRSVVNHLWEKLVKRNPSQLVSAQRDRVAEKDEKTNDSKHAVFTFSWISGVVSQSIDYPPYEVHATCSCTDFWVL